MASFMGYYVRSVIKPHIQAYAGCLQDRLLPSLGNLNDEAKRVEKEVFDGLCRHASEDADIASLAEQALDDGISYYQMMEGITQGLINLFAAGLYHLFEQQLNYMFSHTFPYLLVEDPPSLKFHELRTGFKEAGIDLTKFRSYEKLQELRH